MLFRLRTHIRVFSPQIAFLRSRTNNGANLQHAPFSFVFFCREQITICIIFLYIRLIINNFLQQNFNKIYARRRNIGKI